MKRITFALYLCTALFACTLLETKAATHIVLPNTSIQAKIDIAAAGDTIIVKAGTYAGDPLTIDNKVLDIRPENGGAVFIVEGVTLKNLTTTMNLANFRIGGTTSKDLTIFNCNKVYLDDLDMSTSGGGLNVDQNSTVQVNGCTFGTDLIVDNNCTIYGHNTTWGGSVTTTNSKLTLRKCTVNYDLVANKTALTLLKTTVQRYVNSNHSVDDYGRNLDCVIFQSTLGRGYNDGWFNSYARRTWLVGNKMRRSRMTGEVYIINNEFHGNQHVRSDMHAIRLDGASTTAVINNNRIWDFGHINNTQHVNNCGLGVWITATITKFDIVNNDFYRCQQRRYYRTHERDGVGVLVEASPSTASTIVANNFRECYGNYAQNNGNDGPFNDAAVHAPSVRILLDYNNIQHSVRGGVVASNSINVDPSWTTDSVWGSNFALNNGSACINVGPPAARYNDYGATRNDIGSFGGHRYDPLARITSKPVVLSFVVNPIQLLKGTDTTITIKSFGGIVTP